MHKARPWFPWAAALLLLTLVGSSAGAHQNPQGAGADAAPRGRSHRRCGAGSTVLGPIIGPTSWYDALDDASGLSWLEETQLLTDRVGLGRTESFGDSVGAVTALAEGPDGMLYMGTDGARLWSYDPATDTTLDLGTPVPDECDN